GVDVPEAMLGRTHRDTESSDVAEESVHHGDHIRLSGRPDGGSVTTAHRPSRFRLEWPTYITKTVGSTVQREGPAGYTVRALRVRLTRSAAPRSDPGAPPGAPGRSRRRCRSRPRPGRRLPRPARRGASATPRAAR